MNERIVVIESFIRAPRAEEQSWSPVNQLFGGGKMKIFALFSAGLMLFLGVGFGISYSADVTAIKFANISCQSGPCAVWGMGISRAVRMAAEDIGTFVVAGKSYKWEVIDYDHKYNPSEALSALNRAIFTDNVRYTIIQGAGVHPPLIPLLRENKILNFGFMCAGKKFTNPDNPTTFRNAGSSDTLIRNFMADIYRIYKMKRVATIAPNDEMGRADVEILHETHKDFKLEPTIVAEEFYERATVDFYPALKRMLAKNPDMIFTDAAPTGTIALIAKQARELGFKDIIFEPTGVLEAKVLFETAGKGSDNILVLRMWPKAPTKLYADIERRYEEKYREPMASVLPEGYAVVPWATEAMKKAGTVESGKVIPVLAETPFENHPFGPAHWGGEKFYGVKRQIIYPTPMSMLTDGKWKLVMVKEGKLD